MLKINNNINFMDILLTVLILPFPVLVISLFIYGVYSFIREGDYIPAIVLTSVGLFLFGMFIFSSQQ